MVSRGRYSAGDFVAAMVNVEQIFERTAECEYSLRTGMATVWLWIDACVKQVKIGCEVRRESGEVQERQREHYWAESDKASI